MDKVRGFINKWGLTIMLPIVLLTFINGCGASKEIDNIKADMVTVDSLNETLKNYPTKKNVKDEMERTMLDFLIYEDELDKRKITISQIKEKIEQND